MTPDLPADRAVGHNRFNTTRWSIILSSATAGDGSEANAEKALAHLCRIYWQPIFAFICRRGHSITDAQDLTQDFFVNILEGNLLQRADPLRGRFRSLLLKSLQRFLIDQHDKRSARKRGGDQSFISWDTWMTEAPEQLRVPTDVLGSWTPENLFDIRWAATVVGQALERLREECEIRGRRRVFDLLGKFLTGEETDISYDEYAQKLAVKPLVVKRLVYHLRRRYRALLRQEVARTVECDADIDEEIRYLCAALAAGAK